MESKIPKVIHYCWFGGADKSEFIRRCIGTWRKVMPHYTIKEWNESNFDVGGCAFTRDAYEAKKWAFVADYARLQILYEQGGIYMDTDVKVMRPFDEFLGYNFFSSHEVQPHFYETELSKLDSNFRPNNPDELILGWSIHSAIMASVAGLPYLKDCVEYYRSKSFYAADGSIDLAELIIGKHITINAIKYGYRYVDEEQLLDDNMLIKSSDVFVGNMLCATPQSYAIHLCNGSWLDDNKTWEWHLRNRHPRLYGVVWTMLRVCRKIKRECKSKITKKR